MEFAISIFTEGNRVWPDVPYEEKGSSFRPRLIRLFQVELLRYRVEGNCLASSEHAEVAFSLESIVADANRIVAENPESRWSKDPKEADTNVAYEVCSFMLITLALVESYRLILPCGSAANPELSSLRCPWLCLCRQRMLRSPT